MGRNDGMTEGRKDGMTEGWTKQTLNAPLPIYGRGIKMTVTQFFPGIPELNTVMIC